MLHFIQRSRECVLAVTLALSALHCGQTATPTDEDEGAGGTAPSTGGEGLGGQGGEPGSGGVSLGGLGGASAEGGTTATSVTELSIRTIERVDLLFVIDNSISMADKQALLVQAVPKLIERLVTPDCIDLEDGDRTPSVDLTCALGTTLEIEPVDDLHIGVISSSLGGFGSTFCWEGEDADKSQLIPKVRNLVSDPEGLGFLAWTGGNADAVDQLQDDFVGQLDAVGETGCGFEAPLEAWYRFLVDPSPPVAVQIDPSTLLTVSTGVDQGILQQRAEFLRPDSLVAIVMLTDEDDCSVMEGGGYYPGAGFGYSLPSIGQTFDTASVECATNPNDPCCFSCLETAAPDGCVDTCVRDSGGQGAKLDPAADRANVRCFQSRRRFGLDLLYPAQRYIDGLSQATIVDTQATTDPDSPVLAPNPLLGGASLDPAERSPRPPHRVFLAGIVGVPWQDIATTATRLNPNALEYIDAKGLAQPDDALGGKDRWALILGEPGLPETALECEGDDPPAACGAEPILPLDPFMIDSIEPRTGENPLTGDMIVDVGAATWSPINGSEYDNSVPYLDNDPSNDDLQYACIFPLGAAEKPNCNESDPSCDCGTEPDKSRPLCKPAGSLASTPATTTQYWGKAYPAKRLLQVLKGFGQNSIVASICPKVIDDLERPSFGYSPALNAIIERLAGTRGGFCLKSTTEWEVEDEETRCAIVEATPVSLDCSRAGRDDLDEELTQAALDHLEDEEHCSGDAGVPCEDFSLCAISEVDEVAPCFGPTPADDQPAGYCLIDPAQGPDAGGLGEDCTDEPSTWDECENPNSTVCSGTQARMLRFVGPDTPEKGAFVFRVCTSD